MRSGEDSDGDESYDEGDVKHYQRKADPRWCSGFDTEPGDHGDKGVEDGGGENAFNGAIGGRSVASEFDDFGDAGGEET